MDSRDELEVEAPDAVIEGHSGIQGQREVVPFLHLQAGGSGNVAGRRAGEEFHVAEQVQQEAAENARGITPMGAPVHHLVPGTGGAGLEPLSGRFGMGPVRESDRNAKDVIDVGRAGGILETRPEAEAVVVELSVSDAHHQVASDHGLLGHGEIQSDLQTDISRLRNGLSTEGQQRTDQNQFRFHKCLSPRKKCACRQAYPSAPPRTRMNQFRILRKRGHFRTSASSISRQCS